MNTYSKDVFKDIVKAYYNNNLEEKINELLNSDNLDKIKLSNIISSVCGVSVQYDENYIENLKKAISSYNLEHKIVEKISSCSTSCTSNDDERKCQKSCPFDAIIIDTATHSTYIDAEKCVDCGICIDSCEHGNILDKTEFLPFANLLKTGNPVFAAVAPAICGQFGYNISMDQLRAAFKKIGFKDMFEVAFFADMLTLKEAVEFDEHVKTVGDFMITSCCCPIWVAMIRKVYKDLIKHISPSVSPMIAAGRVLKKLNPNCKVVFIGPCIAKKSEAKEKDLLGDIDYVLTFEELKSIFEALEINLSDMKEDFSIDYASKGGRIYARTGGVSTAIADVIKELFPGKYTLLSSTHANGVKECREMLTKVMSGDIEANFMEGMGCIGGCVGGPKVLIPKEEGRDRVNEFGDSSEFKVATHSTCMLDILNRIGINSIDEFKNKSNVKIFERTF